MSDSLRPTVRTKFSIQDYAAAVRAADPTLTRAQAGILWAQYALETGRGSACWNSNIGNVKVTPAQVAAGTPYFMLPGTWEIINGKKEIFQPPHPQTWFRHFDSLAEAMTHHITFLRDKRYKKAWPSVLSGNPEEFAYALKKLGYYTGSEADYARLMRHFHNEWMRDVPDWEVEASSPPEEPRPTYESDSPGVVHGSHVVDSALEDRKLGPFNE